MYDPMQDLSVGEKLRIADKLRFIAEANRDGRLIDAIKAVRELTGLGLKEAKDLSELMRQAKPFVPSETAWDAPVPKAKVFRIYGTRYGTADQFSGNYSTFAEAMADAQDCCTSDNGWTDVAVVEVRTKSKLVLTEV
jgi:hypothetical protein